MMHLNLFDDELCNEEKVRSREFRRLKWVEESLAKQISKVHWLKEGNQNNKYFFKCVNERRNRNAINGVRSMDSSYYFEKVKIKEKLMRYFKGVLNKEGRGRFNEVLLKNVMKVRLNPTSTAILVEKVLEMEIKEAILAWTITKHQDQLSIGSFSSKKLRKWLNMMLLLPFKVSSNMGTFLKG